MIETIADPYETGSKARDNKWMNQVHSISRVREETAGDCAKIKVFLEELKDR